MSEKKVTPFYLNEPAYVRFADKGDYFLAIRTPSQVFGGARMHGHHKDGKAVTAKELEAAFNLSFTASTREKEDINHYVSIAYVPTNFLDKEKIAVMPEMLADPFNVFLDYLEEQGAEVAREVGLAVYMDSVKEHLEERGYFPPRESKFELKYEVIVVNVGNHFIRNNKLQEVNHEL